MDDFTRKAIERKEQWLNLCIDEFVKEYPGASWGPAHIVLKDKNIDEPYILDCLKDTLSVLTIRAAMLQMGTITLDEDFYFDHSLEELGATADLLSKLARSFQGDYDANAWDHWV